MPKIFQVVEDVNVARFEELLEVAINVNGFEIVGGLVYDGKWYRILLQKEKA